MIKAGELRFPVLCIKPASGSGYRYREGYGQVIENWDCLTITTKGILKTGFYNNMLIIDSDGRAFKIKLAHQLYPVGPWKGYNHLLMQFIRVALEPDGGPIYPTVDQVKDWVLRSFEECHLWSSAYNYCYPETEESVKNASSIREIIAFLQNISSLDTSIDKVIPNYVKMLRDFIEKLLRHRQSA